MKLLLQVVGIVLFSLGSLHAQSADGVVLGVSPFHSYDFGDIDTVELSHGNINLHIPIVSYKQLGQLSPLSISLTYNAHSWVFSRYFDGQPVDPGSPADFYMWSLLTDNTNGVQVIAEPDFRVRETSGYMNPDDPNSLVLLWSADEPTGASHQLAPASAEGTNPLAANYLAIDASGLRFSRLSRTIQDSHGIKYQGVCNSSGSSCYSDAISDSLGNTITRVSNPLDGTYKWIDSANRNIPGMSHPAVGCVTKDYPGPNNSSYPVQFCWNDYSVQTNYTLPYPITKYAQGVGSIIALSSVTLPNNQQWAFTYNSWGELETVKNPLGAVITYEWTTANAISCGASDGNPYMRSVTKRTLAENGTSYVWFYNGGTETTPEGNTIIHTFNADCGRRETKTEYIDKDAGLQKTVLMEYSQYSPNPFGRALGDYGSANVTLKTRTTVLPDGSTSQECFIYDDNLATDCAAPSSPSALTEYGYGPLIKIWPDTIGTQTPIPIIKGALLYSSVTDYGANAPGAVIRKRYLHYKWQDDPNFISKSLLDKVASETIKDGNNNIISATSYGYDESDGLSPTGTYGNNTSITRQLLPGVSSIITRTAFNSTGMPVRLTDAKGTVGTITYQCGGLLPQDVKSAAGTALQRTTSYTYDCNSSRLTGVKDPNDIANSRAGTQYVLNSVGDVASISHPDGGSTTIDYHNYALPLVVKRTRMATPSPDQETSSYYDGLGRVVKTVVAGITSTAAYDSVGRITTQSNPFTAVPSSTDGSTTFGYDVLGRPTSVQNPDGNSRIWSYIGNNTTFSDEVGVRWKRTSDALGRLTKVTELGTAASPLSLETDYGYDVLNNLLAVNQHGASGEMPRTRSFIYDSLSRLTSSSNPESGTITYGYDANSNLQTKISPAPNAAPGSGQTITMSFTYDVLNRLTNKQAPGINLTYGYDSIVGLTYNGIGRLVWATNGMTADEVFSYDPMGRLNLQYSWTPSSPNRTGIITTAKYNLAGNMTDLTYPSGRHIQQAWDGTGYLSNVVYADWSGQPVNYLYASGFSYTPSGALANVTFGNGVKTYVNYNNRLQDCQMFTLFPSTYGSSTLVTAIDKHYYYNSSAAFCTATSGNNGNVISIADMKSPGKTQGFGYDSLNRLAYASRSDGAFSFSYPMDSFGNMQQVNNLTGNPGVTFLSNNQMQMGGNGYTYDAAGNLIDTGQPMYGGHHFTFDAENQLTHLDQGSVALYTYDATGQRVRKDTTSDWTEYVYFSGQPIAEKHPDGSWSDSIFANGQKIARADSYDVRIHFTGTNCSNCGDQAWAYAIPVPALTIQAGDKIAWRQYQSGPAAPRGGLSLQFSDGANTNWQTVDQDGETMNDDTTQNAWHYRVVDLSQYAGKTISTGWINEDTRSGAGHWEEWFSDISFFRQDGTVQPVFNRLNSVSYAGFGSSGVTNQTFEVNRANGANDAQYPQGTTTYYVNDHLGTAQMEFAGGGWPVWQGEFAPYGQEINVRATPNHYKFTGKERDTESGLDNFGARYFGSTMGRFMSPDPLGGDLTNPQSLNRYAYVLNNPLRFTDPTGMYVCKDSEKCDSDADKAFEKARQADLKSKDANVVRGASAYGDPTKDNGVNVAFGDPGKGNDGITSHGLGVGPDGKLRAEESVTIRAGLSGSGLDSVVGHEGSHVADAQDFVSTMTMGGNFDVSKNLSKYQTEFKAYMVSNSIVNSQGDKASYGQGCDGGPCILGFGVGQRQAGNTINQLLANPANGYGVTPKAPGALLYPTLTVPTVPK